MKSIFHQPDIKEMLQRTRALLRDNLLDKDLRVILHFTGTEGNFIDIQ